MTLILSGEDVRRFVSLDDCIEAVENAFRAHGEGTIEAAVLSVHADGGAFHVKTAIVGARFGAKTNANFPSNPAQRGLPSIQGVMLLFDANDGRPLAIMDSIELTALRTAAATAVAAKHLAWRGPTNVAIIGCGRQGRVQLEAVRRVVEVERAFAFDQDRERAKTFASEMNAESIDSLDEIDARIVITCTPSRTPFLHRVEPGTFIAAVGADNPSKSEISPQLMAASRVVTDITAQCAEIGDLHHAIAAGAMTRENVVAELGEIISGKSCFRREDDDIVIFDSTGAGFQDTAVASIIYERARAAGFADVRL